MENKIVNKNVDVGTEIRERLLCPMTILEILSKRFRKETELAEIIGLAKDEIKYIAQLSKEITKKENPQDFLPSQSNS